VQKSFLQKGCQTELTSSALFSRKEPEFRRFIRDYSICTGFWYGSRRAFVV
jgi:hypothetical protein